MEKIEDLLQDKTTKYLKQIWLSPRPSHFYNQFWAKMSIYIITSSLNEKDVQKAKEYQLLKGYIGKPLSFDRLKEVIKYEKNN